jgi:hypothetical protein
VADSSFPMHLSQIWSSVSPSLKRCSLSRQCPVNSPITYLNYSLFYFNRRVNVTQNNKFAGIRSPRGNIFCLIFFFFFLNATMGDTRGEKKTQTAVLRFGN